MCTLNLCNLCLCLLYLMDFCPSLITENWKLYWQNQKKMETNDIKSMYAGGIAFVDQRTIGQLFIRHLNSDLKNRFFDKKKPKAGNFIELTNLRWSIVFRFPSITIPTSHRCICINIVNCYFHAISISSMQFYDSEIIMLWRSYDVILKIEPHNRFHYLQWRKN